MRSQSKALCLDCLSFSSSKQFHWAADAVHRSLTALLSREQDEVKLFMYLCLCEWICSCAPVYYFCRYIYVIGGNICWCTRWFGSVCGWVCARNSPSLYLRAPPKLVWDKSIICRVKSCWVSFCSCMCHTRAHYSDVFCLFFLPNCMWKVQLSNTVAQWRELPQKNKTVGVTDCYSFSFFFLMYLSLYGPVTNLPVPVSYLITAGTGPGTP